MGGIVDTVVGVVGGGGSSGGGQTQNTTVNTDSNQTFAPTNNIDTEVNVDIDIDKLANALSTNNQELINSNADIAKYGYEQMLSTSNQSYTLTKDIATAQLEQNGLIADANYNLNKDFAMAQLEQDMTEQELNDSSKKEDMEIKALSLDEQKQQNKRMTMIALAGLAVTASGMIWRNSKGGKA